MPLKVIFIFLAADAVKVMYLNGTKRSILNHIYVTYVFNTIRTILLVQVSTSIYVCDYIVPSAHIRTATTAKNLLLITMQKVR